MADIWGLISEGIFSDIFSLLIKDIEKHIIMLVHDISASSHRHYQIQIL